MKEGIILLGHGSRREEANEEIRTIARMIMDEDQQSLYETAFLSFGSPDLTEAVEDMVGKGVEKIMVMPIFLLTGNHIARDIPGKLLLQKATHPNIQFVMAKHIGPDPAIAEIIKKRIQEAAEL